MQVLDGGDVLGLNTELEGLQEAVTDGDLGAAADLAGRLRRTLSEIGASS